MFVFVFVCVGVVGAGGYNLTIYVILNKIYELVFVKRRDALLQRFLCVLLNVS